MIVPLYGYIFLTSCHEVNTWTCETKRVSFERDQWRPESKFCYLICELLHVTCYGAKILRDLTHMIILILNVSCSHVRLTLVKIIKTYELDSANQESLIHYYLIYDYSFPWELVVLQPTISLAWALMCY